MDPIKNVGANDYAMTMTHPNNAQQIPEEDYSSMPMVYDPTMDEKKESASSGVALKALGAIALGGLALWAGHSWGCKSAKNIEEAKNAAIKAKDEALAKAKKLQDANDAAYEIADKKHMGILDRKKNLREDIKKALRPDEAEAKTTEEKIAEGVKKSDGNAKVEGAEKTEEAK